MPVIIEQNDQVATLSLNSPDRHNALDEEMFESLESTLDGLDDDHSGPVLRIRGEGPSFCSGFDLDVCTRDREMLGRFLTGLSRVSRRLRRMKRLVVAEVHGSALAGGCALLSSCDLVCVTADARIGYPVHLIGLSPAVSIPTLVNAIGPGRSTELMLSGRIIDGREAARIGLAHRISESRDELKTQVDALCSSLCEKGWNALAVTKSWLNRIEGSDTDEAFDGTLDASIRSGMTEEADRMLAAFQRRRHGDA
jgi:methylglutaconyl-CoA hydratase